MRLYILCFVLLLILILCIACELCFDKYIFTASVKTITFLHPPFSVRLAEYCSEHVSDDAALSLQVVKENVLSICTNGLQ